MNALDCPWFHANNGWHCQRLEGRSQETLYVSTPVLLADGKPLDFYLLRRGKNLTFTDDGLTLFALQNGGIEFGDRRQIKGLENIAERLEFTITDAGTIEALIPEDQLAWWMSRVLRMFVGIAEWQVERIAQRDTDFALTDEVERLLRMKAPDRILLATPNVKLKGLDYSFDFLWGSTYVDAINPSPQSVSARLRKAILAAQEDTEIDLLFILDNRFDPEKADRELPVLGQVARTIRLSDFEESYEVLER